MKVVKTVEEMQQTARECRMSGRRIALVPTMGALHEGHLSLIDQAKESADLVIVSNRRGEVTDEDERVLGVAAVADEADDIGMVVIAINPLEPLPFGIQLVQRRLRVEQ